MTDKKKAEEEVNYSKLLKEFVHPMVEDSDDLVIIEQKYAFGIHVWNAVCLRKTYPDRFDQAKKEVIEKSEDKIETKALFEELVKYKEKEFGDYPKVIIDFDLERLDTEKSRDYNLAVATAALKNKDH